LPFLALASACRLQFKSAVKDHRMRLLILVVGILGAVLFWGLFVVSIASPTTIESMAREGIRFEIQRRIQGEISSLSNSAIASAAMKLLGKNEQSISETKAILEKEAASRVSKAIDKFLDPKCPCRAYFKELRRKILTDRVSDLSKVNERLSALIESKYVEVAEALMKEVRIFSAANAIGFSLLVFFAIFKPLARLQLVIPAVVLLVSLAAVAGVYLFGQNWFHTVLFNEYVGYSYFAYLGVALASFIDIALNKCRGSTVVFNSVAAILGSVVSAIPC
jgi:hypothetical protein